MKKLILTILLALPLSAADTSRVNVATNPGGGATITTYNDIIFLDQVSGEILEIQGVDDLVDRVPTPTPTPVPTPAEQVSVTDAAGRLWRAQWIAVTPTPAQP